MTSIVQQVLDRQKHGDYHQDLGELAVREWTLVECHEMAANHDFNRERIQLLRKRVRQHVKRLRLHRVNRTS